MARELSEKERKEFILASKDKIEEIETAVKREIEANENFYKKLNEQVDTFKNIRF